MLHHLHVDVLQIDRKYAMSEILILNLSTYQIRFFYRVQLLLSWCAKYQTMWHFVLDSFYALSETANYLPTP